MTTTQTNKAQNTQRRQGAATNSRTRTQSDPNKRPEYEALDSRGLPYIRPAQVIGELPLADRKNALEAATAAIATKTGLSASKTIPFGAPVFIAFAGMNRPKAKHHPDSALLLTMGDDVSLDYVAAYN